MPAIFICVIKHSEELCFFNLAAVVGVKYFCAKKTVPIMKNIIHTGISELHNGESAVAGSASELINMREREQALEVVGVPRKMVQLQDGDRVLLVDDDRTLLLRDGNVVLGDDVVLEPGCSVYSAHRVGELLVVVTEQGNELLLRTSTGYTRLNLADAILQVHLAAVESTTHTIDVGDHEFATPYTAWQAPLSGADVDSLSRIVRNAVTSMAGAAARQGRFTGVMLARYGVRLWDDSYLWLSQPVMVGHHLAGGIHRSSAQVYTAGGSYAGVSSLTVSLDSYRLGITMASGVGETWRHLVKAIDVMVSTQAPVVDATSIDYRCSISTSSGTRRYILELGPRPVSASSITQQVLKGGWQVVASTSTLDGSGFDGVGVVVSSQQVLPGLSCYAINAMMLQGRHLTADQASRVLLDASSRQVGRVAMEHNGRLYHAPRVQRLSCPWAVVPWLATDNIAQGHGAAIVIVTLNTPQGDAVITTTATTAFSATSLNPLIAFPDVRATRITIAVGGRKWEAPLSPLDGTGMAVYINPSLSNNVMTTGTAGTNGSDHIDLPSGGALVVSAVGNPLVTQWRAAVSGTSIMGLAAACRPIYSGGFGRYPVYLFTDEGIMALPQQVNGNFGEPRLISSLVIGSGSTPCAGGDGVWMVSRHGELCFIKGSTLTRVITGVDVTAQLAWNNLERELWIASAGGQVQVVMPSMASYRRDLQLSNLYSDSRHALAVDSSGALLDLSDEQSAAAVEVAYLSHPIIIDVLMRTKPRRITWNLFTWPNGSGNVTLMLRGERGSSCHGYIINKVTASGIFAAPLSRPIIMPPTRSARFHLTGTLPTGTLLLPSILS